jgi:hypothetical protein
MFRNERSLYKRKCDATGKEIISIYSPDKPFKVYDQKYWWSDNWDPMEYGREYNWNKSFFEQWKELTVSVPVRYLNNDSSDLINCEYCNYSGEAKNCYLCVLTGYAENCMYCTNTMFANNVVDSLWVVKGENYYQCVDCASSYKVAFCQKIDHCIDSYFLFDCKNCSNCFGCVGLRNKKHHIFNKAYSKEEYFKKINEFNLGNFADLEKWRKDFQQLKNNFPRKYAFLKNCVNVTGNNVENTKNCKNCFDVLKNTEDCKNVILAGLGLKDSQDCFDAGTNSELVYECMGVGANGSSSRVNFSVFALNSKNAQYSWNCFDSSDLFGCIGLRNKQYCILNKQYSKEQYEQLVPKIIEHMNKMPYVDNKGRIYKYGEFFPPELSPFCYNETVAQEYFPLTKEQALEQGYSWKDPKGRDIPIDLKTEDIPDHIKDVNDDIIGKIIECSHQGKCNEQCTQAFKIIKPELEFYRKMNLPLPRLCPNCRHYQRIKQRNPLKLWHRKCMCNQQPTTNNPQQTTPKYQNTIKHFHGDNPCPNEFETTYSPDRPEIVYCEKCYNSEVA